MIQDTELDIIIKTCQNKSKIAMGEAFFQFINQGNIHN